MDKATGWQSPEKSGGDRSGSKTEIFLAGASAILFTSKSEACGGGVWVPGPERWVITREFWSTCCIKSKFCKPNLNQCAVQDTN